MRKIGLVCLIGIMLLGCLGSGEVTKFPPKDYTRLTEEAFSKEKTVTLEHITVRYVPHYLKDRRTVRISGSIVLNREKVLPGSIVTEFALNLFGLDKEYTVLNIARFSRLSVPNDMDTIPFELDLPYTTAVVFIGIKNRFNHIYDLA